MNYTKEQYKIALDAWNEYSGRDDADFPRWLKENIAELLTQTAPKYRCINNSWPFLAYDVEGMIYTSEAFHDIALFPNHFEPVPEEKPITMAEAVEELEEWLYNHSGDRQEIDEIIERMKKAAQ